MVEAIQEPQITFEQQEHLFAEPPAEFAAAQQYQEEEESKEESKEAQQAGQIYAWGLNRDSQVADTSKHGQHVMLPTKLKNCRGFTQVDLFGFYSVALKSNGTVYAWGKNRKGQLGIAGENIPTPTKVPGLSNIIQIASGNYHILALDSNGCVFSAGSDRNGMLGRATGPFDQFKPVENLPTSGKIVSIYAGHNVSYLIDEQGALYSFGDSSLSTH